MPSLSSNTGITALGMVYKHVQNTKPRTTNTAASTAHSTQRARGALVCLRLRICKCVRVCVMCPRVFVCACVHLNVLNACCWRVKHEGVSPRQEPDTGGLPWPTLVQRMQITAPKNWKVEWSIRQSVRPALSGEGAAVAAVGQVASGASPRLPACETVLLH